MGIRLGMGAFLENPMFLFMDDAEPILPIFQSTEYGGTGRIVELADVGCDTETTFPIRFPRGASDRRRGGAESFRSTRRIAKWRNDRPNEFARRATDVNNNEIRNGNYIRGKTRQDNYDDIPDLNYYDSYAKNPYDDLELPKNDFAVEEEENNYYTQFVNLQNAVARSREGRISQYEYLRDLEPPFTQNIRIPQRENISPRWFAESDERNFREIRDSDDRSGERKKRTKILSRTNGSLNREAEFRKTREMMMHHERNNLPNTADPIASSKNNFWDFISFENDIECEETTRMKNHGGLQKMAPHRNRSYIFDSQPKRIDITDSEGEEEFKEMLEKDSQENLSPKMDSARYQISKGNTVKEKPKILRLNVPNGISSRDRSMKTSIDERISNMYPAEKDSINMRAHSATEGKKMKSPTIERREEITSATRIVDDRRYKFVNKLSNKETSRSTKTFNRVADSKSNGRIYATNERDNTSSRHGNSGNSKINGINVSRLAPEEKVMKNKRTFALRMTGASAPHMDIEKEKERKFSRLPVRIWKRLRTKEPAALRPKSGNATNGDANLKLQEVENETAKSNDHPERVENDDVRGKDRATTNRNNIKRSDRFGTGSLRADKSGLTSSNLKSIKGIKDLNTARGTHEQRKKRMNVK